MHGYPSGVVVAVVVAVVPPLGVVIFPVRSDVLVVAVVVLYASATRVAPGTPLVPFVISRMLLVLQLNFAGAMLISLFVRSYTTYALVRKASPRTPVVLFLSEEMDIGRTPKAHTPSPRSGAANTN